MTPAIAAAAMLAFTVSIDDYVITSLVAGVDSQTLPMVIYAMARRGVNPMLNAVSTIVVLRWARWCCFRRGCDRHEPANVSDGCRGRGGLHA